MSKLELSEILKNTPSNWGRWGKEDEVGALNYLTDENTLAALKTIEKGKVFTLGLNIGTQGGDPNFPGRIEYGHYMTQDKGSYISGKAEPVPGGLEYSDDIFMIANHGTTHCDALGHTWFDGKQYNGFDANTTTDGLEYASIHPIAERGIVGRSVLLDIARYKGEDYLKMNYPITLDDIKKTAEFQNTEIKKHDILMIRTGVFKLFYEKGYNAFFDDFNEPAITFDEELIQWFHENEIALYASDTINNEQMVSATTEAAFAVHAALSIKMGVVFIESLSLDAYAKDCSEDGKYDGFFVASPLKFMDATASPINPIIIK